MNWRRRFLIWLEWGLIHSYRGSIRPIEITHTKIHLKKSNKIDVYAIFM